jgi:hypothetical protein
MDDISNHHPGVFDSLLDSAKNSQLNQAAHSLASALGIHADWLTGDHTGTTHHTGGAHVDVGTGGAPGEDIPSDGLSSPQGSLLDSGSSEDQALLGDILGDADYLSSGR